MEEVHWQLPLSSKTNAQDIVDSILSHAVQAGVSDIHIEPLEKALKIRCRVDGVLREVMQLQPVAAEQRGDLGVLPGLLALAAGCLTALVVLCRSLALAAPRLLFALKEFCLVLALVFRKKLAARRERDPIDPKWRRLFFR